MFQKFGVTGVIFDIQGSKRYFLILHRVLNWNGWEFVKGGIDEGEEPLDAVLREIEEESGLTKVFVVSQLPRKVTWIAKETKYTYTPFILKGDMNEPINLEQEVIEHDAHKWVLQEDVENYLTHEDNKKIFREALEVLHNGEKN
ncbi:MAG: hypothetical protein COV47_01165 [Candidatus Diapherotrites archaeon CG11_big_fil_rev_8_21_14_0_20_37_9]|nr:MAG: hypothetical protein COV47_01165 [Candidatus Diapherotrites archaeon CG11_big_fil_rev_8_21_14_0_20_37_9]